jgi:PAS domain-containing protein
MMSPNQLNSRLHEQLSVAFSAAHRAAFENADATGAEPDPMLFVPVRLMPLVQGARTLRRALERESDARAVVQALLDLSGDALVAVDEERRILFANLAARRVLNGSPLFARDADCLRFADREHDRRFECALRCGSLAAGDEAVRGISRLTSLGTFSGCAHALLMLASID